MKNKVWEEITSYKQPEIFPKLCNRLDRKCISWHDDGKLYCKRTNKEVEKYQRCPYA
jgi:hypothetical protein